MCKVSILVPCYNVDKYVSQCIESILSQTIKDIEVICINDGSTDGTLAIINKYAQADPRVKIIDKTNSGYGASMNMGLNIAKGEYIGIVESDDFVGQEAFSDLYQLASRGQVDIVKADYFIYYTEGNISRKAGQINRLKTGKILTAKEYPDLLQCRTPFWTGIYKRTFLDKNHIRFLETPGASYQDTSFHFKALASAERILLTNKAYLYYRQDNLNSSVHSQNKVFMVCGEYEEINRFLMENPSIKAFSNIEKLTKEYSVYKWNTARIDEKYRETFVNKFSEIFKEYYESGELTAAFFRKVNKKELTLLIENPKEYMKHMAPYIHRFHKRIDKRKRFSIRINFSRISIVLFGKQILKIG